MSTDTLASATHPAVTPAPHADERRAAVAQALADIRRLTGGTPDRAALAAIATRLEALAEQLALFSRADFPPPEGGVGASTRYRLNAADGEEGIALYLNAINPGKITVPHNHHTWAVIVAIEGQEDNRIYRRTDDGRDPAVVRLTIDREVTVQPGTSVAFLPEDLHSIHVVGEVTTLHLHLYGRPLETLTGRIGVNLETGEVINYNATQMQASRVVA